jgi:hypothetical protein
MDRGTRASSASKRSGSSLAAFKNEDLETPACVTLSTNVRTTRIEIMLLRS